VAAKFSISQLLINLFFIAVALACILPLILVLGVSFSDENTILLNGFKFIPEKFSLKAYEYLFNDYGQLLRSYGISFFVTIVGTLVSLTMIALYAYPLSRRDLKYRHVFAFFIFFTLLFNGGLVPWYLVYVKILHLKDTIWALIMPLLLSPFFVIIMRTFFDTTIPISILESAKIDGANEWTIFRKIVLPLSLPVLATIGLFDTLLYWNDWFLSVVFITDNKTVSLQYLMINTILNIQFFLSNSTALGAISNAGGGNSVLDIPGRTLQMAMGVLGIGPIVFAYPFFQKYFVRGLTIGAIKG
jgi:putative aldouronate transport system permease protein